MQTFVHPCIPNVCLSFLKDSGFIINVEGYICHREHFATKNEAEIRAKEFIKRFNKPVNILEILSKGQVDLIRQLVPITSN